MTGTRFIGLTLICLTAILGLLPLAAAPADDKNPATDVVRIGLVTTLFRDVPPPLH